MKKYIIVDWCNNILFNDKIFSTSDSAYEFACNNFNDDEMVDIYIEEIDENSRIVPYNLWESSDRHILKKDKK